MTAADRDHSQALKRTRSDREFRGAVDTNRGQIRCGQSDGSNAA